MIKFFRHIRKNQIMENKTGKYFKYAIGEIVLVVIGILIALQINNWNQNRIERNKENLILTELIVDLEEQSKLLDVYIEIESSFYQNGKDILSHFATNQTFNNNDNSMYSKLNSLVTRKTFNPVNTTFQELITTGNIAIIQDKATKRKVIQYYHELERISLIISNNNLHIVDGIFQPEILKHTLFVLEGDDPKLEKMNNQIFNKKSLATLRTTSEKVLSNPDNALHLFNLLEQRTYVAMGHAELYKTIQLETEELLSDLKTQIN